MAKRKTHRPHIAATFEKIEVNYVIVSNEEYNQLLAEWAEIVYCYLCQLSEKEILAPATLPPFMATERTGTNEK